MQDNARRAIEHECEKLSIAYARHLDFKDYDQFIELFIPEGILNITGQPIVGHEQLAQAMATRSKNLRSRHILTSRS